MWNAKRHGKEGDLRVSESWLRVKQANTTIYHPHSYSTHPIHPSISSDTPLPLITLVHHVMINLVRNKKDTIILSTQEIDEGLFCTTRMPW